MHGSGSSRGKECRQTAQTPAPLAPPASPAPVADHHRDSDSKPLHSPQRTARTHRNNGCPAHHWRTCNPERVSAGADGRWGGRRGQTQRGGGSEGGQRGTDIDRHQLTRRRQMLRRGLITDLSIALGEFPGPSPPPSRRANHVLTTTAPASQVSDSSAATPSGTATTCRGPTPATSSTRSSRRSALPSRELKGQPAGDNGGVLGAYDGTTIQERGTAGRQLEGSLVYHTDRQGRQLSSPWAEPCPISLRGEGERETRKKKSG